MTRLLRRTSSAGFTLVELMTVVAIIAILAGIVLGVAGYAGRKTDVARATSGLEQIKNAIEEYRVEYGSYPTNTVAANSMNLVGQLWVKPLSERKTPFLVLSNQSTNWSDPNKAYTAVDPWGNEYRYYYDPDGNPYYAPHNNSRLGYDLWSLGPDAANTNDDLDNWSGTHF